MRLYRRLASLLVGALIGAPAIGDVNVAVSSSAMPATATTQDLTDANIDTLDGAIVFFGRGITNNTVAEEGGISIGFVDGANDNRGTSIHSDDAIGTATDERHEKSVTEAALMADAAGNGSIAEAVGSSITDGLRLTWSDINAQELIGAFMTGNDGAADATTLTLNNTNPVTVTHGLGATADLIVALNTSSPSNANNIDSYSVGFYDVAANSYRAMSYRHAVAAATTAISTAYWNDSISIDHDNGGTQRVKVTVSNCDSDSCDFTASGTTAGTTTDVIYLMFYDFPAGTDIQLGDFTTRTSNGTQADITGMSQAPTAVLYATSFMPSGTAVNTTAVAANEGEAFGFGVAVNNGGTEIASTAVWANDAVALGTTDTKSRFSQDSIASLNGSGALGWAFGISSWDSGGVTHNYTTTDATARRVVYAAIAPGTVSAPAFDTTPTVSAQTTTSYTLSYDANADADDFYTCARLETTAPRNAAEVKAGTGCVNTATEATTGSSDTIDLTITDGDPVVRYSIDSVLEGAGGLGTVSSLEDEDLDTPAGYQDVVIDVPWGAEEDSVLDGASPAAEDNDVLRCDFFVDSFDLGEDAHAMTMDPDGVARVNPGSDTSRLTFGCRFYDVSLAAWSGDFVLNAINNKLATLVNESLEFFWLRNVAITAVTMATLATDPEGDALTFDIPTPPTGITENGTTISGTGTECYEAGMDLVVTDEWGDAATFTIPTIVGVTIPDTTGMTAEEAIAAIEGLCD